MPPVAENTSGVYEPYQTSRILSSYLLLFSLSCLRQHAPGEVRQLLGACGLNTLTSKKACRLAPQKQSCIVLTIRSLKAGGLTHERLRVWFSLDAHL